MTFVSDNCRPQGVPRSLLKALFDAWFGRELWLALARQDIRFRYRRSLIGPFWITMSMACFCLSVGITFSQIFKAEIREYLPRLTIGVIIWNYLSATIGESASVFADGAAYFRDIAINPITLIMRMIVRNFLVLLHNCVILILLFAWFRMPVSFAILWLIPSLIVMALILISLSVCFGIVGVRFRDIAPILGNVLQLFFFLTPITWEPSALSADSWLLAVNPFSALVDLWRSPLMGHAPAASSWLTCLVLLAISVPTAALLFRRYARQIALWI